MARFSAALAALLAAPALALAQPAAITPRQCLEDFEVLWRAVDEGYAYFGTARPAWKSAQAKWRPKAAAAKTRLACAQALSGLIDELRDDHAVLRGEGVALARRVPAETDVWAAFGPGGAEVLAVRATSVADVAGLEPGQVVTTIQGVAVDRAVREALGPKAASAPARDWALRHLLAGPRAGTYLVGVRRGSGTRLVEIARVDEANGNGPPLIARKIGEERNFGYLRIKNNLDDAGLVAHFDAALTILRDTRALILDLRETQSGGSEAVVRAILGRFVARESPWQLREARGKPRTTDLVAPRGPFTYAAPLLVLVDRWTAAEGEALAAGLESAARATLVGTEMAGLQGRAQEMRLRNTALVARFPAERTYKPDGTPREDLRPAVWVDLAHPSGGPGDPILYQALKLLEARSFPAPAGRSDRR
jgi:carboxyl-terminal processing protease